MKKRSILTIILVLILIPVVYFTTTTIMNNMEQENFYNTIKEVSDAENKTDIVIAEVIQNNTPTDNLTFYLKYYESNTRTLNESIRKLKDLNKSIHNETLKEYLDIEITRMQDEVESNGYMFSATNKTIEVLEGNIPVLSSYNEIMSNYNKSNETNIQIDRDKQKAEDFLNKHPDIKHKFEELKIDEDFMILEYAEADKKIASNKK